MKKRLTIAEPCHESWASMQEAGNQCRLCQSCQKEVIDFTQKTDEQIAQTLNQSSNICGRFTQSQINKDYITHSKSSLFIKCTWASILSGLLFSHSVEAQNDKEIEYPKYKPDSINRHYLQSKNLPPIYTLGMVAYEAPNDLKLSIPNKNTSFFTMPHIVSGMVKNDENKPFEGVEVTALVSQASAQTDSEGRYTILLPFGQTDTLRFDHQLAQAEEIQIKSNEYTLDITLLESFYLSESAIRDFSPSRFSLEWWLSPFVRFFNWVGSFF